MERPARPWHDAGMSGPVLGMGRAAWRVSLMLSVFAFGCSSDEPAASSGGAASSSSAASSASSGGAGGGTTGVGAAGGTGGDGGAGTGAGGAGGGGGTAGAGGLGDGGAGGGAAAMNVFVTSDTRADGNFGGLAGADARCQSLAAAVGHGAKTWRAYLSAATPLTHARDRIGPGPYYNAAGVELAADKDALHAIVGDVELFLDETGAKVNGQWADSPDPNEHDIMTGTTSAGMLDSGLTCSDWTSSSGSVRVGHSDGLGPGGSNAPQYVSWNSSHNGQCGNPPATGGSGKIYCFEAP